MTDKEILSMQGTEFIYEFNDGDTIPAYIKKIDIKNYKISCWSFTLTTDQGYKIPFSNSEEEKEDACCLLYGDYREEIIEYIKWIKTGKINPGKINTGNFSAHIGIFNGCPF